MTSTLHIFCRTVFKLKKAKIFYALDFNFDCITCSFHLLTAFDAAKLGLSDYLIPHTRSRECRPLLCMNLRILSCLVNIWRDDAIQKTNLHNFRWHRAQRRKPKRSTNWSCILIVSLSATCSLHSYIHLLKKQMNNLTKFQESSHLHRKTHFLFVFRFSIKDSIIPLACSVNVHCIAARCTYSYQTTCFVERRIMKFNHC